jgi:hypothetical protein
MKRIVLVAAAGLFLLMGSSHHAWAFNVRDVVAMHQDGIPDSLIIQKIRHSGTTFHLGAKDLRALREAGVADEIVSAMLRTEDRGYAYGYDHYPYDYYPDYYYHSWPVSLSFGFGYYRPYYRPYYRSFYRPYYRGAPSYYGGRGIGPGGYGRIGSGAGGRMQGGGAGGGFRHR